MMCINVCAVWEYLVRGLLNCHECNNAHLLYSLFDSFSYVNSVLQALYFCHPFRELVAQFPDKSNPTCEYTPPPVPNQAAVRGKHAKPQSDRTKANDVGSVSTTEAAGPPIPTTPPTMFSALRSLFVHISKNSLDRGTVSPKAFVEKLRMENELFRSTMHQDAHEFLNYLLNKIAEDLEDDERTRSRSSSGEDRTSNQTLGAQGTT